MALADDLKDAGDNLKSVNLEAAELQSILKTIQEALKQLAKSGGDIKTELNLAARDAGSISKQAELLKGIGKEYLKDKSLEGKLLKQHQKVLVEQRKAQATISLLMDRRANASKKEVDNIDAALELLWDEVEASEKLAGHFKDLVDENTKLNKSTKWLDSIGKSLKTIPGIGPAISGPFEKASEVMRKARVDGDSFLKASLKGAGELGAAFGPAGLIAFAIKANSQTVEMSRALGISATESRKLKDEYTGVALESGNALHSQKKLVEAHLELSKEMGVTAGFTKDQVKNQAFLTKRIGVSSKSAAKFAKYQSATGKSAKTTNLEIANSVANLRKETGISLKLSDVFEEVANTNAGLKAAYGFNNTLLAQQVVKTKAIGINMEQAEKIASGMLDFESSIAAELEAELLTGKDLNLEKARGLALEGKSSEAAAEVLNQVGSSADLAKMGVIQQQALAKAVGMERNELIASVKEREVLAKLGGVSLEQQLSEAKTEEEREEIKRRFREGGGEELLQAYERESLAEKFAGIMEKIQQTISDMVEGPIGSMLNAFADILGSAGGLYTILGLIGTVALASIYLKFAAMIAQLKTKQALEKISLATNRTADVLEKGKLVTKNLENAAEQRGLGLQRRGLALSAKDLVRAIGKAAMAAISSLAAIPIWGWAAGLVAAGTVAVLGYKYMSDGVIGPGGEMVVSTPKGSIQLDKDDSIIAGTNLGGEGSKRESKQGEKTEIVQNKIDFQPIISALNEQNIILQEIAGRQTVIEMGGNEVGQGINTAEREVQ